MRGVLQVAKSTIKSVEVVDNLLVESVSIVAAAAAAKSLLTTRRT
jgi:hypothetical protein